jgi:hypothetical protein
VHSVGTTLKWSQRTRFHPSKHCEQVDLRDLTSRGRQARQGKSEAKQHNIKTRQAAQLSNPEGPGGELATFATPPLPSASHIAYRRRRSDWKKFRLPKVQTTWCPRNFQTSFHGCSQDFKQVFMGVTGLLPQHGNLIFTPICVSLPCPLLHFLFWWQWISAFCVPVPNLVIPKKTSQNGKRNSGWWNLRALFKWSLWKETCDDHRAFRLPFQRPFWVSSFRERAVSPHRFNYYFYSLSHLRCHLKISKPKLKAIARRFDFTEIWQKRYTSFGLEIWPWASENDTAGGIGCTLV